MRRYDYARKTRSYKNIVSRIRQIVVQRGSSKEMAEHVTLYISEYVLSQKKGGILLLLA